MKWHYHYYCITHNDNGILNKVVVERAKRLVEESLQNALKNSNPFEMIKVLL